jgi:hypothetical protein
MSMTRALCLTALLLCASLAPVHAQSADSSIRVLSGALTMLDIPQDGVRAFDVLRAIRVLHSTPRPDDVPAHILELERLLVDVDLIERQAARTGGRGLALEMARTPTERDALQDTLAALGLRLREQRRVFSVESRNDRSEVELRKRLLQAGIDAAAILERLNSGATVRIAPAAVELPLPLPVEAWAAVFGRPVPPEALFSAIIRDREASLLYYGVQAMTARTRAFVAKTPDLLQSLKGNAPVVAAYGGAFRLGDDGAMLLPGGPAANELWEALVGERVTRPDRFGRDLFGRDGGRLAYFVDALWALDDAHQRFALGLSIADRVSRASRFQAVYAAFVQADSAWSVAEQPFSRPSFDAAHVLSVIDVTAAGQPAPPAYRKLWERAADGIDMPDPGDRQMRDPAEDGVVDAAFLVALLEGKSSPARRAIVERLAFAQRNFGGASDTEMLDVLVALRAYGRFPGAMRILERIGIRRPAVFAQTARRAAALEAEEPSRSVPLLAQFQASLALLDRLARTAAVDTATLEQLVTSLTAIAFVDGQYEGRIADWVRAQLLPALAGPPGTSAEERLLDALADRADPGVAFSWEGDTFVVDFSRVRRDVKAVRAQQGGNPLDRLLAVHGHATALAGDQRTLGELKSRTNDLRAEAAQLAPARPWPDAPDALPDVKKIVDRALKDLDGIRRDRDLGKAPKIASSLIEALDYLLGETLVALAYAPVLDDAARQRGPATDISHRHVFGFAMAIGDASRLVPWRRPARGSHVAIGDALTGSLLGLDLATSQRRLRRLASEGLPQMPRLNGNDRTAMTDTVALLNPRLLTDGDLARIGGAVLRGRTRIEGAAGSASVLDLLAMEGRIAPVRRQLLAWTAQRQPTRAPELFSIGEIFRLGGGKPDGLDPWGTSHESLAGCFCLRFPDDTEWDLATGRGDAGQIGARFPDLNLRVAELLADLKVPAALFPAVMALATQDYIDTVPALHADDWAAMAGHAAALGRERVSDYVSAVVANGPVRRVESEGAR